MTCTFRRALLVSAVPFFSFISPAAAQDAMHDVDEHAHADEGEENDVIIVQGTRLGRRLQDEPIRVEVIAGEEIEEKAIMRPGNIAMLVNETGGVRVQVTSPALGAANIRIQGIEGRYTQLLADNLPLYGGQAASLGLLQIPPTDLAQVEVIKGSVSALYGASALAGVINLVSKRPGDFRGRSARQRDHPQRRGPDRLHGRSDKRECGALPDGWRAPAERRGP